MIKTNDLSIDFRRKIIDLQKAGKSYGDSAKCLLIPRSTVQSIGKKFRQHGTMENLPGRWAKPKMSQKTVRKVCREATMNPRIILKEGKQMLDVQGTSASTRTIQRQLEKNGLHGCRPNKENRFWNCVL